ncbi:MAG: adenine phosphoribosyltransferase [Planctomycetaceae bacterium]
MSETTANERLDLREHIRDIPDFPKPGILFRDITPLLATPAAFRETVRMLAAHYRERGVAKVCAAEARGFLFAAPLALELNAGFVPVRKPGKLPFDKHSFSYELEYGHDSLEMHIDALAAGDRVLLVDDLLATGGTMQACVRMVERTGAVIVGCAFVIELNGLKGRDRLAPYDVYSLVRYEGA